MMEPSDRSEKVGIQTILWGPEIDDLPSMLNLVRHHGFRGIEFAQRPATLPPINELLSMLSDRGIRLLGLSGGSLEARVRYCADLIRPEYLYVEGWDAQADDAQRDGFTLAL